MKKISTLFKKNPDNLALVINEVNPENKWVFDGEGVPTRKYDGTPAAVIDGVLYKRYDVKEGRSVPPNAIPCQEPDAITGHWPHWVPVNYSNPENKAFVKALDNYYGEEGAGILPDGTYELVGPKVQGNPERFEKNELVSHGKVRITDLPDYEFETFRSYFQTNDIEGIVFHHIDGRMCKIRKSDFGIKR